MDVKDIKDIIELIGRMQISHFELEKQDIKLIIKNHSGHVLEESGKPPVTDTFAPEKIIRAEEKDKTNDELLIIKSPMVGVYYSAPSPESGPFVEVGSKVKLGDTLCIVEAMKIMNEITSEYEGEIVEILIENGEVVEYGQPIMSIKKQRGACRV